MPATLERLAAALSDRYRIEHELGQGGMATVYLAEDLKHDRKVAIKVLKPELAAVLGAERFVQEIKTTAALSHPHILPLFDSGEAGGFLYYVMPFIEGETIREKLNRETQFGIEEAVRITTEVADALDYAHRHGVIHRDIKPENILLHDGRAIVMDFGIALAVSAAAGGRMTETGLSLGTPHYMSPEQATADKTITARSDIYSLASVLYEMLTGEPPHTGASGQAIIMKIIADPVRPVTELRKAVPPNVAAAVAKALEKLPADRFASAAHFAEALSHPFEGTVTHAVSAAIGPGPRVVGRGRWWPVVAAAAAGLAVIVSAIAIRAVRQLAGVTMPAMYDVALSDSAPIVFTKGSPWGEGWTSLAISPKGDFALYVADRGSHTELWYRSLLDSVTRPLPGTAGAYQLAMHPDGESVAFIAGDQLKIASLASGSVRELGKIRRPVGMTWLSRDRLLVSDNDAFVSEFDRLGGLVQEIRSVSCSLPFAVSPTRVLCDNAVLTLPDARMDTIRVRDGGRSTDALPWLTGRAASLAGNDFLLYAGPEGTVIGARWRPDETAVEGRTEVLSGVRTESIYSARQASVSASGTLVYVPGPNNAVGQLVRTRDGVNLVPLPIKPLIAGQFDLNRDGHRLALTSFTVDGVDLLVYDLASGASSRLLQSALLVEPRWSPDGQKVAVYADKDFDGVGGATLFVTPGMAGAPDTLHGAVIVPTDWYDAGHMLGYTEATRMARVQLAPRLRVDTLSSDVWQQRAVLSADGRLVAFMRSDEVLVETFPERRGSFVVARGVDPAWLDNRTLVYGSGGTFYTVSMRDDASLAAPPRAWFRDSLFIDTNNRSFTVTRSGEVIYLRSVAKYTASSLRVIPRWTKRVEDAVEAAIRR